MANLLGYLGNMSIHRLLMGGHSIKLRGWLGNGLTKGLIGLGLSCYEILYEALQVRIGLKW